MEDFISGLVIPPAGAAVIVEDNDNDDYDYDDFGIGAAPSAVDSESGCSSYGRLAVQIFLGLCLPFLLIGSMKVILFVMFSPTLFFGLWAVALILGVVSNAVIEFDFQHGYPAMIQETFGPGGAYLEEVAPAGDAEPDYFDADAAEQNHQAAAPGLSGQGESPVDAHPPPQLSSNLPTRSRPLKLRKSLPENWKNVEISEIEDGAVAAAATEALESGQSSPYDFDYEGIMYTGSTASSADGEN